MRELGRVAARYFDDVIIREDVNPRGRERGETAAIVLEGVRAAQAEGARAGSAEIVTDEMTRGTPRAGPQPPRRPGAALRGLRLPGVGGARSASFGVRTSGG